MSTIGTINFFKGVCKAIVPMNGLITREGRAEGKSPSEGKRWGSNKGLAENQTRRTEEGSEVVLRGAKEERLEGKPRSWRGKKATGAEPTSKESWCNKVTIYRPPYAGNPHVRWERGVWSRKRPAYPNPTSEPDGRASPPIFADFAVAPSA